MSLQRLPMCAELVNARHNNFSLVDLGCRTMDLKPLLRGCEAYLGTDMMPGDNVVQCDLEQGLPQFEENSQDVVVALDVLEHLENCHLILSEMLRVARKTVYISLPNMYYLSFRLRFMLKGNLSGKYSFPKDPILDRHRWVLSYNEAVNFIDHNTKGLEVFHHKIIPERGRTKLLLGRLERHLGDTYPDLFAYGSLHEIRVSNL